jgi:aldose 1-epimerase
MPVTASPYGTLPSGKAVTRFTLRNANGLEAEILDYGGIVAALRVPDCDGRFDDIVLGKPSLEGYLERHPYFGAITGRVAGRITGGRFTLDGEAFELEINNGPNHLHGGLDGLDRQLWEATADGDTLRLHHLDPDGHNGYPGNLDGTVSYTLSDDDELRIDYRFTTDKPTPLTVTNHSYFNLKGEAGGKILDHEVQILASEYALAGEDMTLLGRKASVDGQANDFRQPALLADRIDGLHQGHGDLYFLDGGRTGEPRLAARVREASTGRVLETLTTEPCLQFYASAQMEEGENGKTRAYGLHDALCLETQAYPDAVNHPELGDIVLRPGQAFRSTTTYRFSVEEEENG